jgi:hypothetical protein
VNLNPPHPKLNPPHPNPLLSKERGQDAEKALLLTKEKVVVDRMRWICGNDKKGASILVGALFWWLESVNGNCAVGG